MIPRELLGTARIPGGGELRLFRHDRDFMILLDRDELMSSRMSGSEAALATMTIARIAGQLKPQLLIGGYGMGFTLRAALAALPASAVVAAGSLDDPRVRLIQDDVGAVIRAAPGAFDAILLDVDNGPDGLVRAGNDWLYGEPGLRAAKAALRPGGVLAIWSAAKDDGFARRLKRAGFAVDEVAVRARNNGKGAKHIIWFAALPPAGAAANSKATRNEERAHVQR
jgi:spermidine synthase